MPKKESDGLYNFTDVKVSKTSITTEFNLPGGLEEVDFVSELKIDRGSLDNELTQQPSKYAFYATLASIAEDMVEQNKLKLQVIEAELDKAIRQKAMEDKIKLTETQVNNMMVGLEEWQDTKRKFLSAKKNMNILNSIVQAWEHRKSMLVSLSLKAKRESEDDIEVMKNKVV